MSFFFFWNLVFFFVVAISTNSAKHHIQLLSILKLAHIHPSLVLCWNLFILNNYSNWRPFTIRETIKIRRFFIIEYPLLYMKNS
jgi:hypothetical protein